MSNFKVDNLECNTINGVNIFQILNDLAAGNTDAVTAALDGTASNPLITDYTGNKTITEEDKSDVFKVNASRPIPAGQLIKIGYDSNAQDFKLVVVENTGSGEFKIIYKSDTVLTHNGNGLEWFDVDVTIPDNGNDFYAGIKDKTNTIDKFIQGEIRYSNVSGTTGEIGETISLPSYDHGAPLVEFERAGELVQSIDYNGTAIAQPDYGIPTEYSFIIKFNTTELASNNTPVWKTNNFGIICSDVNASHSSANKISFVQFNTQWNKLDSIDNIVLGQDYVVAGKWDGTNLSLFIDGVLQSSLAITSIKQENYPVTIGGATYNGTTTSSFNGDISNFEYFETALSDEELISRSNSII